ncbi:MAG: adenosine kinase [Tannerellaceae bacterium]|nr:adenosine kinase [Tannerellaceae bacterium]
MSTIGLGNALVDVLLKLHSDAELAEIGIAKGAMDMINENTMRIIQQKLASLERTQSPGGSVCNAMRAIACLGGRAGFFGKIGTDELGEYYEKSLLSAGVEPYFTKEPGISGCCTVLISPDGERSMGTFLGPAPTLTPEDISEDIIDHYDCIYIEGYMVVNESLVCSTMEKAKRLGVKVALDLSNFNIVNSFKNTLSRLIAEYVDILFSNEAESKAFTGLDADMALVELSKLTEIAVVTLGKNGAIVAGHGETIHVDAYGTDKPLDTTGAGDHFAAGFLYSLSEGASLEKAARTGALLAGHVVNVVGPQIPLDGWELIKLKVNNILS